MTNLADAAEHIGEVLRRVKKEHLQRAYKIQDWYVCSIGQGALFHADG